MKRIVRRLTLAGSMVFALSHAAVADESIRFTTDPSPVGLAHWWAEAHGIFAKNGLKYTDTLENFSYAGLQLIGAGSNDVASMNEPPLLTYLAKGVDGVIIAALAQDNNAYQMVVPTSITSLDQLKGKSVTWLGGSGAEYGLIRILQTHGMTVKDFNFLNLAPAEEVPILLKGDAVGMWSWEPWPRKVLTDFPDKYHVIATSSPDTYDGNYVTVVRRDFAQQHPQAVEAYLRSLKESIADIRAHQDEAVDFYAKRMRVSHAEAEAALTKDYTLGVIFNDENFDALKGVAGWLKDTGHIAQEPDWSKLIDTSYLKAVDPSAVSLSK